MRIEYANSFDSFDSDEKSSVFQVFPEVFEDNRGYFMEVGKHAANDSHWIHSEQWTKQTNRSSSSKGVIRGCHAQKGKCHCQGKLVEAITNEILDTITDMRPESRTFGRSRTFVLDSKLHNQLWIPRGFLHSVAFNCEGNTILQYFCDETYDKESEITVNPKTVLIGCHKDIDGMIERGEAIFSEKDLKGISFEEFKSSILEDYSKNGKPWYD